MDFLAPIWNTFIYNPMLNALLLIYRVIPNYGFAIILFTLLIGIATSPFRIKSQQSMRVQQTKMAALKPKLDEIKKKYKDQPQELQKQQMALYKEHGVGNPFNAGCLLTLLPFPIFIGLYNVITQVMGDKPEQMMLLAQHVYPVGNLAALVPVSSSFFGLNLAIPPPAQGIPVAIVIIGLVVGASWVQQKMMTQPAALDAQSAQMNQSMQLMMPLMFGFFVWNAPVGLALYWITFSIVGIVQQYMTNGWGGMAPYLGRFLPAAAVATAAPGKPKKISAESTSAISPVSTSPDNGNEQKAVTASTTGGSKKGKKKRAK